MGACIPACKGKVVFNITPTNGRPRFLPIALCLLVLVGVSFSMWAAAPDNPSRVILVVPFKEYVADLKPEERQKLEDALGGNIDRMIDVGIVREGDMIDLAQPAVWFSYNFNKWVRLQSAAKGTLSIVAMQQWNEVEEAWKELNKKVHSLAR